MSNTLWLSEIDDTDTDSVGDKAVSLSRLYQSSFPVPPAFCVTREAFKTFIENAKNSKYPISEADIPDGLKREIEEAYENINVNPDIQGVSRSTFSLIKAGRDSTSVVIRISGDKLSEKSTILNVRGSKNLINSIKKLWNIAYSEGNNPALIVQKMVSPSISGVISFDDNEMVLRSVYGFLDSGNINYADTYKLDKDSLTMNHREKKIQEYKIVRDDMIDTIANRRVFSDGFKMGDNELRIVGNVGQDLVDEYGDKEVEFAMEGSKVYLLGIKDKRMKEPTGDSLPDLITPIPDTLLSFEPLKRDNTGIKEEIIEPDFEEKTDELIEIKLGDIHIKVPKNKKSVEAAYKLLDAISSHLE